MGNEQQDGDDIEEEEDSTYWDDEVEVHQHSVHVVVDGEEGTFQHRHHRTCCIQLVVVVGSEDDGNHVLHMDGEEVHKENGAERDTVLDSGVGMHVFHSRVGLLSHVRTDLHSHRPPCFRSTR